MDLSEDEDSGYYRHAPKGLELGVWDPCLWQGGHWN